MTYVKLPLLALSLLLMSSLSFAQLKGDTFSQAKAKGTAELYCTYISTTGFNETQTTGTPKGICPDIMQAFADYVERKEGIQIKLTYKDRTQIKNFNTFLDEVKQSKGGVFGVGPITITEDRKKELEFSPAFLNNISVLVTHNSKADLSNLSNISTEFAGMKAYTATGTSSEKRLLTLKKQFYPGMEVKYISTEKFKYLLDENGQPLFAANKNAFASIDFIYYLDMIKKSVPVKRHAAGDEKSEKFGLIMPKGSDWTPLINEFLKEYKKSSEYKKSLTQHLSASTARFLGSFE